MVETSSVEVSNAWKNGASSSSLAERAYHLILDRMLRGNLPIGSVLSRRKLAEEFHMSLVPVAQALQRLEIEASWRADRERGPGLRCPIQTSYASALNCGKHWSANLLGFVQSEPLLRNVWSLDV